MQNPTHDNSCSGPPGFSEESRTHSPPLPLHPVAGHGRSRIHSACPVLHQSILPGADTGDGTRTGTLQVHCVCVLLFLICLNWEQVWNMQCVLQCRCWKDRNLHSYRQHAAADPGSGYSERSGFPKTCPDAEELPGSDGGKWTERTRRITVAFSILSILFMNKVCRRFSWRSPVGAVRVHPRCSGGGHLEPWHLSDLWPPPHLRVWPPDPRGVRQNAHGQTVQGVASL